MNGRVGYRGIIGVFAQVFDVFGAGHGVDSFLHFLKLAGEPQGGKRN